VFTIKGSMPVGLKEEKAFSFFDVYKKDGRRDGK
jgi:hypothetical protein